MPHECRHPLREDVSGGLQKFWAIGRDGYEQADRCEKRHWAAHYMQM